MSNEDKTKKQLADEVAELHRRVAELEKSKAQCEQRVKALEEERDLLYKLMDSLPDGIFLKDTQGRFIIVNKPVMESFKAKTREGVTGKTDFDFMPREWAEKYRAEEEEIYRTGRPMLTREQFVVRPTGEKAWALSTRVALKDSRGRILGIVGINRDITKLKRAEERAEHLNAILRAIRNVNQLLVKERNRDRLLQGVCDNLVEARGFYSTWVALTDKSGKLITAAEAGLGEDFLSLAEQLRQGKLIHCVREALAQSDVVVIDGQSSTCKGCPLSGRYADSRELAVRLEYGGDIYGLLVVSISSDLATDEEQRLFEEVARDLAFALHGIELEEKHRQAEEELRRSEERYRDLFENTSDLIQSVAPDGQFVYVNRAWRETLGYREEEVANLSLLDIIHPDSRAHCMEVFQRVISGEKVDRVEAVFLSKDGREIAVEGSVSCNEWEACLHPCHLPGCY